MKISKRVRAYGSNGGSSGGGYEICDPDYTDKHLSQLKRDYWACPEQWRACFFHGLSKFEQEYLTKKKGE